MTFKQMQLAAILRRQQLKNPAVKAANATRNKLLKVAQFANPPKKG